MVSSQPLPQHFSHKKLEKEKEEVKRWEWVGFSYSFPISGLGEPNIYHDLGLFYKNMGVTWRLSDLWRISGGYSQVMIGVGIGILNYNSFIMKIILSNNPFGWTLSG